MVEPTQVPIFNSSSVKLALERLRQARPLGNNPLRRLIWLEKQTEEHGPLVSPAGVEVALWESLVRIIEERLNDLRILEQQEPISAHEREAVNSQLRADFSTNNDELRAWSILYHRYARVDLNLKLGEIASMLAMDPRQIRRHMTHGLRRLTEHLSNLEVQARSMNWQMWLSSKLPPPSYATIFGFDQPLQQLLSILEGAAPPQAVIVTGPGGSGKTTLARLAAQHLIAHQIFQDLAWLTLEPPATYNTLLTMLAADLGYYHLAHAEPAELEGSLRVRLEAIPTIVIIDNADSLERYDAIFPRLNSLISTGRVLAIMRPQPTQGIPIYVYPIPPLSETDLIGLIRETAGLRPIRQVMALGDSGIQQIAHAVGGNPLAAKTVTSQLAFLPLDRVLSGLPQIQTPEGELLFDRLYGSMWSTLPPEGQRVAIALSILTDDDTDWATIQMITELPPNTLDAALSDLGTASFIDVLGSQPGYSMPPLARTFVIEQANREECQDVYRQMLAATITQQQSQETAEDSDLDIVPENAANLVALMRRQIAISISPEQIGATALAAADQAQRAGVWAAWREVLRYVRDGLQNMGDYPPQMADIYLELGIAARWLGDFEEASSAFEEGLARYRTQNNASRQSLVLIEMGQLYETLGQTDFAFQAYEESLQLAGRQGLSLQRRRALNGLAGLALNNDRPFQALELLQEATTTDPNDPPDGQTLSLLGSAYLTCGKIHESLDAQQQAIDWFLEHEDYPRLARAYMRIGMAFHAAEQTEQAFQHLQQGLALMREMADAFGQARLFTNLGVLYASHNHWQDALVTWKFALSLQEKLNDRVGIATTVYNIADLEWKLGRLAESHQNLNRARGMAEQLNLVPLLEKIRTHPLANP